MPKKSEIHSLKKRLQNKIIWDRNNKNSRDVWDFSIYPSIHSITILECCFIWSQIKIRIESLHKLMQQISYLNSLYNNAPTDTFRSYKPFFRGFTIYHFRFPLLSFIFFIFFSRWNKVLYYAFLPDQKFSVQNLIKEMFYILSSA